MQAQITCPSALHSKMGIVETQKLHFHSNASVLSEIKQSVLDFFNISDE